MRQKEEMCLRGESPKLGDAELTIMQAIWQAQHPVTAGYIRDQIKEERPWALSTLMTTLTRLCDKGFVVCDKSGRNNAYSAKVQQEQYRASESRSFLEKLYNSSVSSLVTTLYSNRVIGKEELDELRRLIDEIEEE